MELCIPDLLEKASPYFIYGEKGHMHQDKTEIIPIKDTLKNLPEILSAKHRQSTFCCN